MTDITLGLVPVPGDDRHLALVHYDKPHEALSSVPVILETWCLLRSSSSTIWRSRFADERPEYSRLVGAPLPKAHPNCLLIVELLR